MSEPTIPATVLDAFREFNAAHQRMLAAAEKACSAVAFYAGLAPKETSIATIQGIVARAYGIALEELTGPRRTAAFCEARQQAMWLCRNHTESTLGEIGAAFNRDHTAVSWSVKKAAERAETEPKIAARQAELSSKIEAALAPAMP